MITKLDTTKLTGNIAIMEKINEIIMVINKELYGNKDRIKWDSEESDKV